MQRAAAVGNERGDRKEKRHGVGDGEERSFEPVGYASCRIGERRVRDQRVAELADGKEGREAERVVRIAKLPEEEGEAGHHHQGSEAVARAVEPGCEAGEDECPGGDDARLGPVMGRVEVVDLDAVGDHA